MSKENKIFLILEGNNGATYIFNVRDMKTISLSLRFYKSHTLRQKILKISLMIYLNVLNKLSDFFTCCNLKNRKDINQYLRRLTDQPINFELDEMSSIFISSTRDKIIVHHHHHYFHKFAFNKSYKNVKKEVDIYRVLNKKFQSFKVSKISDCIESKGKNISFKLSPHYHNLMFNGNMTTSLVELFNVTRQDKCLFSTYIEDLENRYTGSGSDCSFIKNLLNVLRDTQKSHFISLGFVHRDFKPWNIDDDCGLLIYDFEEALVEGPPMEDMLNYNIDPMIRYTPIPLIAKEIFSENKINEYRDYLESLQIKIDFLELIYCHLIERVIFWKVVCDQDVSSKYCELIEYIFLEQGKEWNIEK